MEEESNCIKFVLERIWKLEGLPTEEEKNKLVQINQLCEKKGGKGPVKGKLGKPETGKMQLVKTLLTSHSL